MSVVKFFNRYEKKFFTIKVLLAKEEQKLLIEKLFSKQPIKTFWKIQNREIYIKKAQDYRYKCNIPNKRFS